jgi:hypothetical protein
MKGIESSVTGCWNWIAEAQKVGEWLVEGPKRLFADVDATTDFLKLVQRINSIFAAFVEILPLKRIADGVTSVIDLVDARNIVGCISDLISGKAAWKNPFSDTFPDLLKVASKLVFLIGDTVSLSSWLSSVHVLGEWVKSSTAQIVTWGKEFNVARGIGDACCVIGSMLNIADTIRLSIRELTTDGYIKDGVLKWRLLRDHLIDVAYDITCIAASVLSNIPGVPAVMATASLAIGSTLSLGRFFIAEFQDKEARNVA